MQCDVSNPAIGDNQCRWSGIVLAIKHRKTKMKAKSNKNRKLKITCEDESRLYKEATEASNRGDAKGAVKLWHVLAKRGNADARYELAVHHETGRGVKRSSKEAAKWYRLAAKLGNVDAQFELGLMYGTGRGVRKNSGQAVKWLWHAAQQGNGLAQLVLECDYSGH